MPQPDLYSIEVPEDAFSTRCGGNLGGSLESCVSYAEIPGQPGAVVLRDTKLGSATPELRFTAQEMTDFLGAFTTADGDDA